MKKTILQIDGMMCGMCEAHVADAIRRNFNTKKITASHIKGTVIIISEESLDPQEIKNKIGETGYKVLSIKEEEYVKKGLFSVFKK